MLSFNIIRPIIYYILYSTTKHVVLSCFMFFSLVFLSDIQNSFRVKYIQHF